MSLPNGDRVLVMYVPAAIDASAAPIGEPLADSTVEAIPLSPARLEGSEAAGGTRFVWAADASGTFTHVDPVLADIGLSTRLVGRRWRDIEGRTVASEGAEIGHAFSLGRPFRRLPFLWRRQDGSAFTGSISGAPDRKGGRITGFRGHGQLRLDLVKSGVAFRFVRSEATPQAATGLPRAETGLASAVDAAWNLTGAAGSSVLGMLQMMLGERPTRSDGSGPTAGEAEPGPPAAATVDDIAKALAAQTEPSHEKGASMDETASAAEPDDAVERILAALGQPAAILRDDVPLVANGPLLSRFGCRNLSDLVSRGALDALNAASPGAEGGRWRRLPIVWRGRDATFLTIDAETSSPEMRAEPTAPPLVPPVAERPWPGALSLASDAVLFLDGSTRILDAFGDGPALTGRPLDRLRGSVLSDLIVPADHRAAMACLDEARGAGIGGSASTEVRLRAGEASTRCFMRIGLLDPSTYGVALDTRSAAALAALRRDVATSRAAADKAARERTDLLARVSHEIRAPLTAIVGFAELMHDERFGPLGGERYKGYAEDIQRSGTRVLSLVEDVLTLAEASLGDPTVDGEMLDLNSLARQAVSNAASDAAQARTVIRTSYASGAKITANSTAARQIVGSVISEAVRLAGAGGQVIVSTSVGSDRATLRVKDNKPGLTVAQAIDTITPFRRPTDARLVASPSFALSIARATVEAQGGRLNLATQPGSGLLIDVEFPVGTSANSRKVAAAE